VVTRLSPTSCHRLATHSAVLTLLNLIKTLNRSKPHVELLRLTLSSIGNMCSYPELANHVVKTVMIVWEGLIEVLERYTGEEEIVYGASRVLSYLVKTEEGVKVSERNSFFFLFFFLMLLILKSIIFLIVKKKKRNEKSFN